MKIFTRCQPVFAAVAVGLYCLLLPLGAAAVVEVEQLSSPELQARYKAMIEELRCPKCQNQNLAGSNSPIAADLRREVRHLLEQGRSDAEITGFLVSRYGDFVLYRPPVQRNTLLLWLAPLALLAVGLVILFAVVCRQRRTAAVPVDSSGTASGGAGPIANRMPASEEAFSREEQQRLADLLGRSGGSGTPPGTGNGREHRQPTDSGEGK